MKPLTKIALILILSLLTAPVLLLKGCGTTTPHQSTLSATQTTISLSSISGPTCYTGNLILVDKDNLPLNGMPIQMYGSFAAPRTPARYRFYDGGQCNDGSYRASGFTGITDDSGVYKFSVGIVAITDKPVSPTAICGDPAGLIPYTYQIAALDYNGEASPASEAPPYSCTGGTISNTVNWVTVDRAPAYAIIGRLFSSMQLLAVVTGTSTTSYIDTGATTILAPPTAVGGVIFTGTPGTTSYQYAIAVLEDQTPLTGAHIASARGIPSAAIITGSATLDTNDYFTITWAAVAGASYYAVYRRIGGGDPWTLLAVVSGLTYSDTGTAANSNPSSFSDTIFATSGTAAIGIAITLN